MHKLIQRISSLKRESDQDLASGTARLSTRVRPTDTTLLYSCETYLQLHRPHTSSTRISGSTRAPSILRLILSEILASANHHRPSDAKPRCHANPISLCGEILATSNHHRLASDLESSTCCAAVKFWQPPITTKVVCRAQRVEDARSIQPHEQSSMS